MFLEMIIYCTETFGTLCISFLDSAAVKRIIYVVGPFDLDLTGSASILFLCFVPRSRKSHIVVSASNRA
jgi:hypothetical protein